MKYYNYQSKYNNSTIKLKWIYSFLNYNLFLGNLCHIFLFQIKEWLKRQYKFLFFQYIIRSMKSNKENYYGNLSSLVYNQSKPPGTSIDGDIEFYTNELIKRDGLVLEAGVGNGRMAIPLLRKGISIFGLDNSKEMLAIYEENLKKYNMESQLILGDLINFETDLKFETIIMPNGSFCLLNRNDIYSVLSNFKRHLTENGKIYLDLIFPTSFKPGNIHEYDFILDNNDTVKIKNKSISIDWLLQKTYTELEYLNNSEIEIQPFSLWWYGVEEFKSILEKLEFKNIKTIKNYNNIKNLNLKTLTFVFEK
ncbi:S-adenosylmethionine:2-demethylmenaquinone methyltransferase [Mesoplasma florum L1]|uniref:S-adenosylmethionine:2-demethylmenaquinone methyltransferase n=2 Tax=Mesoplasma florum TaxID=2151 RepID=Q6F239_MESFL|nr:S-adenosylmethionine:2-demethylmenaquinone methyltransferase [Mesoplasma florum L1]ATI73035.1 class I SAM-dependent methyltransferase [Mesoplasma florum]ATI73724.1 class I SAM-dependent methyltransferase [Mesoplasma florum]AVN61438.1 S-adenosylmethionine--2-demethylmenaquinone methyltransferase [Mesoplasma florum]